MARVSNGNKSERVGFIDHYGSQLGYRYLCDWLEVSPAGYYKWRDRGISKRAQENRLWLIKIQRIFDDSQTTYGSPRVHEQLCREGEKISPGRVERLMRTAGLVGKAARVYRRKAM